MAEYTYKDVIIDPEDPRVEIGKEYYFGSNPSTLLWGMNSSNPWTADTLLKVNKDAPSRDPFYNGLSSFSCIIRKKEPVKKYVPFDLSDPDVRKSLRGKWIRTKNNNEEKLIWWFWRNPFDGKWVIDEDIATEELLSDWVFDSDGSPCGKLVEEE